MLYEVITDMGFAAFGSFRPAQTPDQPVTFSRFSTLIIIIDDPVTPSTEAARRRIAFEYVAYTPFRFNRRQRCITASFSLFVQAVIMNNFAYLLVTLGFSYNFV